MSKSQISNRNDLVLVNTKDIHAFLPLMKELREFGDRFLLTMLRWCGYGRERVEPLAYWQVYVAKIGNEPIGVTGLYRQMDTPKDVCWIGWFGVRPSFRGQGLGRKIIEELKNEARIGPFKEMWVYTDDQNAPAIKLYENLGFVQVGTAEQVCPSRTSDLSDIILKCNLKEVSQGNNV